MATTTKTVLGNIVTAVINNITKIKEAIGNASTSDAGLMSGDDKTKLDGVDEGATKTTVVNNLTTTETGSALDAAQGKVLSDRIASFQTGVDTLYNKCVAMGGTPTSKTPNDISSAFQNGLYTNIYTKCASAGVTPTAVTYPAVGAAVESIIASSGSGSSEQAFIVYPSMIIGVMGDGLSDASTAGTSTNFNSLYFTQTMKKVSSIPNGGGVWAPFRTLKLGQKGYNASQDSSYPYTLFSNSQDGGNIIYYPSSKSYTEVVMTSKAYTNNTAHGGPGISSSDTSKYPHVVGWYGSIDLLKFNDGKTRIYLLGNTFEFGFNSDNTWYFAGAKEIVYSVMQIL